MQKVYIVMIHDKKDRPYVYAVYKTRRLAEDNCKRLNLCYRNGEHADFISEDVIDDTEDLMDRVDRFVCP